MVSNLHTRCGKITLILGVMIPIIAVLCILGASQKIFAAESVKPINGQITGEIEWTDIEESEIAELKLTVNLCDNTGEIVDTQEVSVESNWKYTFSALNNADEYEIALDSDSETSIADKGWKYTINEENNTISIAPAADTDETVTVSGSITWDDSNDQDDERPATSDVTTTVLANGKETTYTASITDNGNNTWTYSFAGLPKYAEGGRKIQYTVQMDDIDGYFIAKEGGMSSFLATHEPGKISFDVSAVFDDTNNPEGIRPESITVYLYADGKYTEKIPTLDKENGWKGAFENLIKYNGETEIKYTISLEEIDGFIYTINGNIINLKYKNQETSDTPSDTSDNNSSDNTSGNTSEVNSDDASSESSDASKTGEGANTSLLLALLAMFICLNAIYLMNAKKNSGKHFIEK